MSLNECSNSNKNNCGNDANAVCVDQDIGFLCKCDYEWLGVYWDNTAKKCALPGGGEFSILN